MAEKNYLILLDLDTRKRHYHFAEAGIITKFAVQLEVKVGDTWKEVIRYDCAHGYAHRGGSPNKICLAVICGNDTYMK